MGGVKERKTMVDREYGVGQQDRAWPPIIGCRGIADIIVTQVVRHILLITLLRLATHPPDQPLLHDVHV